MHRCLTLAIAMAASLLMSSVSAASNTKIAMLKQRLDRDGPDAVNAYLYFSEQGWKEGKALFRLAMECDIDAMNIVLRLMDTINASATKGNSDVLELAMGRCPERLLPLTPIGLVPQLCSVDAWSESKPKLVSEHQRIAEIDRRTAQFRHNSKLTEMPAAKTCLEAYTRERVCIQFPARPGC